MPRPSVLITRRIPSAVVTRLESVCDTEVWRGDHTITPDELQVALKGKQGLICVLTDRIDGAVMDAAGGLRIVANIAVGYENIDLAAARERQIVVTNTPDVLTNAVAEFTWGLIIAVTRRIAEGDRLIRRDGWKGWALDFMLGSELAGKQIGIIGMGRIGRAVASHAPAFGMRVAYMGRPGAPPPQHPEAWAWERLSFDELLVSSDVLTIHVPLRPDTRHLIDQRALARMKRSAYLINTARGPVVDEAALVWALKEHLLAGAALDVYEREPEVHRELLDLENVVLTPHLGSGTQETRTAMTDLAARNVAAVLSGHAALTPVTG